MSDEARDAYLQRLDDCAKETDYETWLEGRVAQLEEELATSMAYADKLAAGLPDGMLPKDVEVLRKANHGLVEENAALSELLSPLVDVELERDVAMSENQRLTKHVEDYAEENVTLKRLVDEYKPHVDGVWEQVKLKTKRIDELEEKNVALKRENEAFGDFANTIAYTSDGKRRSSLGLTFTKALEDLKNALLKEQE